MTGNELQEWLAYHGSRFPDWLAWWKKYPTSGKDVTQQSVADGWWDLLRYVDLADAKQATDAMNGGSLEEPRTPSSHVRAIASYAKRNAIHTTARRTIDGQPLLDCAKCLDMGLVEVWHPMSMKAARSGEHTERKNQRSISVACDCKRGSFKAEKQKLRQYDANCMLLYDDSAKGIASLGEFANRAYENAHAWHGTHDQYAATVGRDF